MNIDCIVIFSVPSIKVTPIVAAFGRVPHGSSVPPLIHITAI
jgi:hypothetical protein